MNVLLIDPDAEMRSQMESRLREFGLRVLPFADGYVAFVFLLARLREIDAVIVNEDLAGAVLRRLALLGPLVVVTYSGSDLERGAEIETAFMPPERPRPEGEGPSLE